MSGVFPSHYVNVDGTLNLILRSLDEELAFPGWIPRPTSIWGIVGVQALLSEKQDFEELMRRASHGLAMLLTETPPETPFVGYHLGIAHILEATMKRIPFAPPTKEILIAWVWSMDNPSGFESGLPKLGVLSAGWI